MDFDKIYGVGCMFEILYRSLFILRKVKVMPIMYTYIYVTSLQAKVSEIIKH